MICPDCKGEKTITASHVSYADGRSGFFVPLPCSRCNKTGEVPDEMAEWMRLGKALKAKRMDPYRNLCEEAARRGIDVVTLSKMEMGKIKPVEAT